MKVSEERLRLWMQAYGPTLYEVVLEDSRRPAAEQQYGYGVELVPSTLVKMEKAFREGTFNLDGKAIARTARAFNIKPTRKAITQFLEGT